MIRALPFLLILTACAAEDDLDLAEAELTDVDLDPAPLADEEAPPPAPPVFNVRGTCPGPVNFTLDLMRAGGQYAVIRSNSPGLFLVPSGPCAGTPLGVSASGIALIGTFPTPALGFNIPATLPPAMCGKYLVAIDLATCLASNVIGPL